mmetsp:Transcript_15767/g.18661  ORF Transcript_15767/g.18661 Transcript_15767/m.18661 type:complete len:406 (+) Transcript_15767:76-1293(+)
MVNSALRSQQANSKVKYISIIVAAALISHGNLTRILGLNSVKAFTLSRRDYIRHSGYDVEGQKFLNKMRVASGENTISPDDFDLACEKVGSNGNLSQSNNVNQHNPSDAAGPDVEAKKTNTEGYGGSSTSSLVCEKKLIYDGAGTLGDIMSCTTEDIGEEKGDERMQILGSTAGSNTNQTTSTCVLADTNSSTLINSVKLMQNGMSTTKAELSTVSVNEQSCKPISLYVRRDLRPTSGLVTSAGGTLQSQFGHKISNLSPIDRIALTANGNMQRIVSSFYDAPVHVYVEKCRQRCTTSDAKIWDRTVHLSVFNQVFCKATSVITVHSSECAELVRSEVVGIGQLFRHLDKLPTFTLLDAGRTREGGLWRSYQLQCQELTCNIREELSANAWEIIPMELDDLDNTF